MQIADRLRPYVPGFTVDWLRDSPDIRHRHVEGTLAFVDVSGFTKLTERLAARGKVGAEEMTGLLDGTFAALLGVAYDYGAWLVKWGGDAVLLLFQGEGHAARACTAALEMRTTMDVVGRLRTSCGPVRLRVSTGVHTGSFDMFLVGSSHHELVITGPGATTTAEQEASASAGQVAVSPATAAQLPPGLVRRREDGVLLLARSPGAAHEPLRAARPGAVDLGSCLPALTRDYLLSGDDDAEHRLVGVAFVEFAGVDALLRDQGPGAATDAVDAVIRTCQEAAARHDVTFWETDISRDGGKVMLVAGAPVSTGSEQDALLAVAREVVDAGGVLPVRVGVNSGRVFFGQFGPPYRRTMSVKGDAVNLAARLMARAGPGEVLAAAQVVANARTAYAVVPLEPFLVKGKSHLIYACRVGAPRSATAGGTEHGVLVARGQELDTLRAEWDLARHGQLRDCELVGEAGIGKSHLVHELARSLDATVVEVRCDPYTATTAYEPFRRVLRDLLGIAPDASRSDAGAVLLTRLGALAPDLRSWAPLLATVVGAEVPVTTEVSALDERFRVRRQEEVTVDLLDRLLPAPTLLVVEDAHLLDPSSATLLRRLPELAESAPWLVVRCRREEGSDEHTGATGTRIDLLPLDLTASLALLHRLTDDNPLAAHEAETLVARSGGNPLFLTELATASQQSGPDELPTSVEGVVAARIDRLRPSDRRLLRAAAVVGRDVDLDVLLALCARVGEVADDGALARLGDFLAPAGARAFSFRQALVQETAYERLPYGRRVILHGHLGDVLVASAGDRADENASVLSLHFLRAQRHAEAGLYARLAGARALQAMAHAEAAELLQRALTASRQVPDVGEDLAPTWESLGDARYRLAQFTAAADAYGQARRLHPDGHERARLHHKTALCAERTGSYRQALRWLSSGLRLLGPAPQGPSLALAAEIGVARATVRHWQGRHLDAARECRRTIELATEAGSLDIVAETLVWLDVSELMLGEGDGTQARRALAVLQQLGDRPWQVGRCMNALGIRAYYAGDWDGALGYYRACSSSFTAAGDAWAASLAQANLAEILCDQGRLGEAEPLLQGALRAGRAAASPGFTAFVQSLLGRLDTKAGRHEQGLAHLAEARRQYDQIGEPDEVVAADARTAECLVLSGDPAGALALVDALEQRLPHPAVAAVEPLLLRVRGLALTATGRTDEAETALRAGLASARARNAPHEVAFTLDALAGWYRSIGVDVPELVRDEHTALTASLGIVEVAAPLSFTDA